MINSEFFYAIKNPETDLYVLDNDLISIFYTDKSLYALKFFNLQDIKHFINYLKSFYNVDLYCVKVVLRENKFICQ